METKFLTAPEIADVLKISRASSYRLLSKGEIPYVKFGRTLRVRDLDLEAFIARKMVGQANQMNKEADTRITE